MAERPLHVYCQQVIGTREWCQRKAVAPDPRNPATSSLCTRHLAEVEANVSGSPAQELDR